MKQSIVVHLSFKEFRLLCINSIAAGDQAINFVITDYSALLEMQFDGLIVVYITTSAAGFNHYERTEFDFIDTKFRRLSQPCRDSGFWRDNCQLM